VESIQQLCAEEQVAMEEAAACHTSEALHLALVPADGFTKACVKTNMMAWEGKGGDCQRNLQMLGGGLRFEVV